MGTTRVVSCGSLYRLLSNNELLAAFANAGFTPPGTVESRNAAFAFSIQQANNRLEEENELRKLRIKARRVAREKFWEKVLPLTLLEMRNGLR